MDYARAAQKHVSASCSVVIVCILAARCFCTLNSIGDGRRCCCGCRCRCRGGGGGIGGGLWLLYFSHRRPCRRGGVGARRRSGPAHHRGR